MPKRHVDWQMGKMYGRGWLRGCTETEADLMEQYHLNGITYREICDLLIEKGRVTLRNSRYPMVVMVLSIIDQKEINYIAAIGRKFRWGRHDSWRSGAAIRLTWQGFDAQVLIRKLLLYIPQGDMRQVALKALKWTPKGGKDKDSYLVEQRGKMSVW